MMSQFDNSTGVILANQVPLFASSWIALFLLIRHRMGGTLAAVEQTSGKTTGATRPTPL